MGDQEVGRGGDVGAEEEVEVEGEGDMTGDLLLFFWRCVFGGVFRERKGGGRRMTKMKKKKTARENWKGERVGLYWKFGLEEGADVGSQLGCCCCLSSTKKIRYTVSPWPEEIRPNGN